MVAELRKNNLKLMIFLSGIVSLTIFSIIYLSSKQEYNSISDFYNSNNRKLKIPEKLSVDYKADDKNTLIAPGNNNTTFDNAISETRKTEVLEYSRKGNFRDTRNKLKTALDEKIISEKEYYSELAHMLSISVKDPVSIAREIIASGNKYGYEVMIANLSGNEILAQEISSVEKSEIYDLINENKPEINGFINNLGLTDIYRYENWINSLRIFSENESIFIETLEDIIENKISDPREAFGIQYALRNDKFFEQLGAKAKKKYSHYINNYLESYPDNQVAKYINEIK